MATKPTSEKTDTHRKVEAAVEAWYKANYPAGVRLTGIDRLSLAAYVAQRLGGRRGGNEAHE